MGQHDDDYPLNNTVPNAVTRLQTSLNFRNNDTSGMGPGTDIMNTINYEEVMDDLDDYGSVGDDIVPPTNSIDGNTTVRIVWQLPLKYFHTPGVQSHHCLRICQ